MIDNFSKFCGTIPLKIKSAETRKDSFENILISSKKKPNLVETDDGSEFVKRIFTNLLKNNNIKRFSKDTSLGAVFAVRFVRTITGLLKRPTFPSGDGNWVDILATKTKQYNNRIHLLTKLTPIQASLKKKERFLYKKLLDKRQKKKPK